MRKTVLILLISLSHLSFSQTFDTELIFHSGTNVSRINLVILSDGYTQGQLDQFVLDATSFTDALFAQSPYKEYKNYFNVYAIKVPSNQSGASHPGNATDVTEPQHPISIVDNYFESTFDAYGIHRLLVSNNSIVYSTLANNFPLYDIVLVLVNTPHYGGSGGAIAVSSLHTSANNVAIHELGHSFGRLADEYYAGDVYAREEANMTQETNPNLVKWKNWLGTNNIGIYNHCCGGASADWYRPHQQCKMRYINSPFCAVCIEATIEQIHSLVSPIASYGPAASTINLIDPVAFHVQLIEPIPNSLNVVWSLNGNIIHTNVSSATLSPADLVTSNTILQVTVVDNSTLLKIDNHETIHFTTILWNINKENLSIDEVSENSFKIEIFPNPAQDVLNFNITSALKKSYTISILDLSGKKLLTENFTSLENQPQMSLAQILSGMYVINFRFEDGTIVSSTLVKE